MQTTKITYLTTHLVAYNREVRGSGIPVSGLICNADVFGCWWIGYEGNLDFSDIKCDVCNFHPGFQQLLWCFLWPAIVPGSCSMDLPLFSSHGIGMLGIIHAGKPSQAWWFWIWFVWSTQTFLTDWLRKRSLLSTDITQMFHLCQILCPKHLELQELLKLAQLKERDTPYKNAVRLSYPEWKQQSLFVQWPLKSVPCLVTCIFLTPLNSYATMPLAMFTL